MSSLSPPPYRQARPTRPSRPSRPNSPYQRYNQYFKDEAEEDVKEKRNFMQPLMKIFNFLQTGQYVSANLANELIDALDDDPNTTPEWKDAFMSGLKGGLSLEGGVQGSYKDIVERLAPETDTPIGLSIRRLFDPMAEKNDPSTGRLALIKNTMSNLTWADVLGFVGDVALDPTTWIPGIGWSKGAKAGATKYADDVVKLTLKKLTPAADDLKKLMHKGFKQETYQKILMGKGQDAASKYLQKYSTRVGHLVNQTYKQARQEALGKSPEELLGNLQKMMGELPAESQKLFDLGFLGNELTNERAVRWFGQEVKHGPLGKGVRPENMVSRSLNALKRGVAESGPGKWFSEAVYNINNRGIIGEIRNKIGIRNPYQRVLREQELMSKLGAEMVLEDYAKGYYSIAQEIGEDVKDLAIQAIHTAEKETSGGMVILARDVIGGPKYTKLPPEKYEQLKTLITYLEEISPKMRREANQWAGEGVFQETDELINYLYSYVDEAAKGGKGAVKGTYKPGVTRQRTIQRGERLESEKALLKYLGLAETDEQAATIAKKMKSGGFSMDLDEIMVARFDAHARMSARNDLIMQMREFGIPVGEINDTMPELALRLTRHGADIEALGLSKINDPAFEGLLFDTDVSDILNRVISVTGKEQGAFRRKYANYMAWWRGMVTASPGFNARNFWSNNVTGFLHHGPRWFSIKKDIESLVLTNYALKQRNPRKFLNEVGIKEGLEKRILNKRYGNLTGRELADYMRETGVISEATMGHGAEDIVSKIRGGDKGKINPFSKDFYGIRAGHTVSNYIENSARVKSFMFDYEDIISSPQLKSSIFDPDNLAATSAERLGRDKFALEEAKNKAKLFFLDYQDLTPWEQNVGKNIFGFYTWMRKALASQIAGITLHPDMWAMMPKAINALAEDVPEADLIPPWMRQRNMFSVGDITPGMIQMFGPDLPYLELNKIPLVWEEGKFFPTFNLGELKDDIMASAAPVIKSVVEVLIPEKGYDLFYKQELYDTRKAPYLFRLFASNPKTMQFVDGAMRAIGIEDGSKLHLDDAGKLRMGAKMAKLVENHLPLVRRIGDLLVAGMQIPGLEEALEEATGAKDDYEAAEQFFQFLSRYSGIKFKAMDLEKEKERLGYDISDRAGQLKDMYERRSF